MSSFCGNIETKELEYFWNGIRFNLFLVSSLYEFVNSDLK